MAATESSPGPQGEKDRSHKRRPFAAWVRRLTSLKSSEQNGSGNKKGGAGNKHKKNSAEHDKMKNNPYPESGFQRRRSPRSSHDGQSSYATPLHHRDDDSSIASDAHHERDGHPSNRSKAPTVATIPDTIHSDAGHSKAFTNTTGAGALSSIDGAGNGSTFSSPNQSAQSLTTTLTTIQSTSPANTLQQPGSSGQPSHGHSGSQGPVMFSHQYPVSPAPSTMNAASAIPRHLTEAHQGNVLTDDASIVTLASSSKRRRRSMDTDASVRALAPGSAWGGSRESLPLSVLSGTADGAASTTGIYAPSITRPSVGFPSAERASVYSSQGVAAPALASERNSYYAGAPPGRKDLSDAKSLRSVTGIDARSQYDARSINDAKSMDTRSLRNYEGSMRSGALGHGRNDSIPGSIGSPLASPGIRHASASGAVSRRSSDWQGKEDEVDDGEVKKIDGEAEGDVSK